MQAPTQAKTRRATPGRVTRAGVLGTLASGALAALFPHHCQLCDLATRRALALCLHCEAALRRNSHCCRRCALPLPASAGSDTVCAACLEAPFHFHRVLAPFVYSEEVALLVSRWKYGRDMRLTHLLAALWLRHAQIAAVPDCLLPVPLHWQRLMARGFNQAELLACALRRQHPQLAQVAVAGRLVRRRRATTTQARLGRRQRRRNTGAAFALRDSVEGLHVAIVDDVCTTGATANAIAGVLRKGGAAGVELWCLARTPAPEERD